MNPTYESALRNAENALRELKDVSPDSKLAADVLALIMQLNSRRIALMIERKKKARQAAGFSH